MISQKKENKNEERERKKRKKGGFKKEGQKEGKLDR